MQTCEEHTLKSKKKIVKKKARKCNKCRGGITKGEIYFKCDDCKYRECTVCFHAQRIYPKDHELVPAQVDVGESNGFCDACDKSLVPGESIFSCYECRYDECANCYETLNTKKDKEFTEASLQQDENIPEDSGFVANTQTEKTRKNFNMTEYTNLFSNQQEDAQNETCGTQFASHKTLKTENLKIESRDESAEADSSADIQWNPVNLPRYDLRHSRSDSSVMSSTTSFDSMKGTWSEESLSFMSRQTTTEEEPMSPWGSERQHHAEENFEGTDDFCTTEPETIDESSSSSPVGTQNVFKSSAVNVHTNEEENTNNDLGTIKSEESLESKSPTASSLKMKRQQIEESLPLGKSEASEDTHKADDLGKAKQEPIELKLPSQSSMQMKRQENVEDLAGTVEASGEPNSTGEHMFETESTTHSSHNVIDDCRDDGQAKKLDFHNDELSNLIPENINNNRIDGQNISVEDELEERITYRNSHHRPGHHTTETDLQHDTEVGALLPLVTSRRCEDRVSAGFSNTNQQIVQAVNEGPRASHNLPFSCQFSGLNCYERFETEQEWRRHLRGHDAHQTICSLR